jgi:hypothetical protein
MKTLPKLLAVAAVALAVSLFFPVLPVYSQGGSMSVQILAGTVFYFTSTNATVVSSFFCNYVIINPTNATFNFNEPMYASGMNYITSGENVTVLDTGQGTATLSFSSSPSSCSITVFDTGGTLNIANGYYLYGTNLTVQDTPNRYYGFSCFIINGVNYTGNPCQFTVTGNTILTCYNTLLSTTGNQGVTGNPAQWLNYWLTGNFLMALVAPFLGTMGSWFYAFLLITIMLISWFKTKSIFMLGFISAIYTILMVAIIPAPFLELVMYAVIFAVFYILIKLFSSG